MVRLVVNLQPTEVDIAADVHTAVPGGPHTRESGCALKEAVACESPHQSRLPAGAETCGEELMQEHLFWQELKPMGNPHWSSLFLKDCAPWEGPMLEQFMKNCSHGKDPRWSGSWRTVTRGKDRTWKLGAAWGRRSSRAELLWTHHSPHPPVLLGWERKSEDEPGKMGEARGRWF